MSQRLRDHIAAQGLGAGDLPTALLVHELLGLGWMMASWGGCYVLQPTRRGLARAFGPAQVQQAAERAQLRWQQQRSSVVRMLGGRAEHLARGLAQRLPPLRRADRGRLLLSLAESSI
eukprot:COSAG01_NODE_11321_length_1959_cov_1.694624_1_plen_117_part_10